MNSSSVANSGWHLSQGTSGFGQLGLDLVAILNSAGPDCIFISLFIFRYLRFVVHTFTGVFLYRPSPEKGRPTYCSKDVAVIVPTVDPTNTEFATCLVSILENSPKILIISSMHVLRGHLERVVLAQDLRCRYPRTTIHIATSQRENKREQVSLGLDYVKTHSDQGDEISVVVLVDDQVSWGGRFLPSLLAAFEDPGVGLVGTNKKASCL